MKSFPSSSAGCSVGIASTVLSRGLVLARVPVVGLSLASGSPRGGGMDSFSSASSRASIFVKTVAMRAALASGCSGVFLGTSGSAVCVGLPPSGLVLIQVGVGRAFLCVRGVREGSAWAVAGWEGGVGSGVHEAGEAEVFLFAAHGGLTHVGFGVGGTVETGFGVGGAVIVGFGMDPEAVRFLPIDVEGVGATPVPSHMNWSPSCLAISRK
jgi:hypothetical protein